MEVIAVSCCMYLVAALQLTLHIYITTPLPIRIHLYHLCPLLFPATTFQPPVTLLTALYMPDATQSNHSTYSLSLHLCPITPPIPYHSTYSLSLHLFPITPVVPYHSSRSLLLQPFRINFALLVCLRNKSSHKQTSDWSQCRDYRRRSLCPTNMLGLNYIYCFYDIQLNYY